jgi:hypothetical protein
LATGSNAVALVVSIDREIAGDILGPDNFSGLIDPDLEDNILRIRRATSAVNKEDSPPPITQKAALSAALLAAQRRRI